MTINSLFKTDLAALGALLLGLDVFVIGFMLRMMFKENIDSYFIRRKNKRLVQNVLKDIAKLEFDK